MHYSERDTKGYFGDLFQPEQQWKLCLLVSSLILAASVGFFLWCLHVSDDRGGDSFVGLVFAITSTVFLFLAAVSFSLRRRARHRVIGELNAVLNWHICFGVIALVMVFLHAFGNYNPRTGTYALYGMIALVISGIVGRVLDRYMAHLIAQGVHKVLNPSGQDRVETIWNELQSTTGSNQALPGRLSLASDNAGREDMLPDSWDMGYISLQGASQRAEDYTGRLRSSRRDVFVEMPGTQEDIMGTIEDVQQTLKREVLFRSVIRYWRIFHIILAVVTVGLTLWHIEYALSLVLPALQKYGFGYLLPWP